MAPGVLDDRVNRPRRRCSTPPGLALGRPGGGVAPARGLFLWRALGTLRDANVARGSRRGQRRDNRGHPPTGPVRRDARLTFTRKPTRFGTADTRAEESVS